jgi:hypothetical protein
MTRTLAASVCASSNSASARECRKFNLGEGVRCCRAARRRRVGSRFSASQCVLQCGGKISDVVMQQRQQIEPGRDFGCQTRVLGLSNDAQARMSGLETTCPVSPA